MSNSADDSLVELLSAPESTFRMQALHLLCEGYASDPKILQYVLDGWDQWGAEEAFPEFPMLSHVPIPADRIETCCKLATTMAEGKPLTDKETRCAGRLIEQLASLPASELAPHLEMIESTVSTSKIFFRVDMEGLRSRIEFAGQSADALAAKLDVAIAALTEDSSDASALRGGLHALEALRRSHPDYMHLPGVLAKRPQDDGAGAVSFQLTIQSLIAFPGLDLESCLAKHLADERESVLANVVEALVRCRSHAAARAFIERYDKVPQGNRQWIARGLQRLRTDGQAEAIAKLRATVDDPTLWLMLLIAEARQLDEKSIESIASDVNRIVSYSEALIDSLNIFAKVHENAAHAAVLQTAFMEYLKRSSVRVQEKLAEQKEKVLAQQSGQPQSRKSRDRARRGVLDRFKKKQ